jgi:hypothetical protein
MCLLHETILYLQNLSKKEEKFRKYNKKEYLSEKKEIWNGLGAKYILKKKIFP